MLVPTSYSKESDLQLLIAEHPEILARTLGGDHNPSWLLIRKELSVVFVDGDDRTRWYLDHLFVDAQGIPTLVEVKRSSDPRARREVIAQMLDYGASFAYEWTGDRLRNLWAESFSDGVGVAKEAMQNFLANTTFDDEEAFWAEVTRRVRRHVDGERRTGRYCSGDRADRCRRRVRGLRHDRHRYQGTEAVRKLPLELDRKALLAAWSQPASRNGADPTSLAGQPPGFC